MTIGGLWPHLSKKTGIMKSIPQASMRGWRLAIDASNFFYKMRCSVWSKLVWSRNIVAKPITDQEIEIKWLLATHDVLSNWEMIGITPVLVYDGAAPVNKDKVKQDRVALKQAKKDELAALLATDGNALTRGPEFLKAVQELMCNMAELPRASVANAKMFFSGIGIPTLQAIGEAERLCSMLCIEGKAIAYSEDGDNLAHGAPYLIRRQGSTLYQNGSKIPTFEIVFMADILSSCGMTQAQFTDACIMSGCDYNQPMNSFDEKTQTFTGKRIITKSFGLIRTHGSIEGVAALRRKDGAPTYDITPLDHSVCRELFSRVDSESIIESGFLDPQPWSESAAYQFEFNNMTQHMEKYKRVSESLPQCRDFRYPVVSIVDVGFGPMEMVDDSQADSFKDVVILVKSEAKKRRGKAPAAPPGAKLSDYFAHEMPASPALFHQGHHQEPNHEFNFIIDL